MKTLVAYYSRTGGNKKVALEIAKLLKADFDEIKTEVNYGGFFGFLRAGFDAKAKKVVKISSSKDPSKYGLVVLVSPLWAGSLTPALRSYVTKNKFNDVAFFSCCGSGGPGNSVSDLEELKLTPKVSSFITAGEVKGSLYYDKVKDFCGKIKKLG